MLFRMLGPTMKNLMLKPATRRYPFDPYVPVARTRGKIVIDYEKCNFCLLCDRRCPTHAILVDRPGKVWQIDRLRCIQCGRCVEVCPKSCLVMDTHYPAPVVAGHAQAAVERHEPAAAASGTAPAAGAATGSAPASGAVTPPATPAAGPGEPKETPGA